MSSIRVKFIRGEEVKFISHLDQMKFIQRAIRRADLPIAYSQGFNPHPQMVFALPLSVGVTSQAEYADIELKIEMNHRDFIDRLNKELPLGLKLLEGEKKLTKDNIMATITLASYDCLLIMDENTSTSMVNEKISDFLKKSEILVNKQTKKGTKEVDIRPLIHRMLAFSPYENDCILSNEIDNNKFRECDILLENINVLKKDWISYLDSILEEDLVQKKQKIFCISMLIDAGSISNLKSNIAISALCQNAGFMYKLIKMHRTGLFIGNGNDVYSPFSKEVLFANSGEGENVK